MSSFSLCIFIFELKTPLSLPYKNVQIDYFDLVGNIEGQSFECYPLRYYFGTPYQH